MSKKYTAVCISAQGYYSGASYEGWLMIPEKYIELFKNNDQKICCYIHELDGKHSEIKADVAISEIDIPEPFDFDVFDKVFEGDDFWELLPEDTDIGSIRKEFKEYANNEVSAFESKFVNISMDEIAEKFGVDKSLIKIV